MMCKAKILIIGDTHIPRRADKIPEPILSCIDTNMPYDYILFTGDLVEESVKGLLKRWSSNLYIVKGNMDFLDLPNYLIINVCDVRFGLIHGHQVYPRGNLGGLARIADKMGVKVLVSGHTHNPFATEYKIGSKEVILLNPGSATGVWSGGVASMKPSFMICALEGSTLITKLYELDKGRLCVKNYMFSLTNIY